MFLRAVLTLFFVFAMETAVAESFQGNSYGTSLSEIQKKFPQASITPVKAVWVTEDDGFFVLQGPGFVGQLYMFMDDPRPGWRRFAKNLRPSSTADAERFEQKAEREIYADVLTVRALRWLPPNPIPVQRYALKYGKPDRLRFSDIDMSPYYAWDDKGVTVALSDDEKFALAVEFNFTREERILGCMRGEGAMRKVCEAVHPKTK